MNNLIDTKYLCDYYHRDNDIIDKKCKIYYILHEMEVIDDKQLKWLEDNQNAMGPIYLVHIDIHNLSDEVLMYSACDTLYLTALIEQSLLTDIALYYTPANIALGMLLYLLEQLKVSSSSSENDKFNITFRGNWMVG